MQTASVCQHKPRNNFKQNSRKSELCLRTDINFYSTFYTNVTYHLIYHHRIKFCLYVYVKQFLLLFSQHFKWHIFDFKLDTISPSYVITQIQSNVINQFVCAEIGRLEACTALSVTLLLMLRWLPVSSP